MTSANISMSFPVGPPRVRLPSAVEVSVVQGTHWGRWEYRVRHSSRQIAEHSGAASVPPQKLTMTSVLYRLRLKDLG